MLLLMSLAVSAETGDSLMTVDWNSIKAEVRANPQRVQNLVDEFINVDSDLTMTAKDRILAVYGRTYLNNGSDMSIEIDMMKVRRDGKFEEAATIADRVLAKIRLIRMHSFLRSIISGNSLVLILARSG